MSELLQKNCPICGKPAIKIERDRGGMRTCECGNTWYPSKLSTWPPKEETEEDDDQ